MEDEEGQEMNETKTHLRKMNKIMAGSSKINEISRVKDEEESDLPKTSYQDEEELKLFTSCTINKTKYVKKKTKVNIEKACKEEAQSTTQVTQKILEKRRMTVI